MKFQFVSFVILSRPPHPIHYWNTLSVFYLSPEFVFNFLSKVYTPPGLKNIFKFVVFILLENIFSSQQVESWLFYLCPLNQNPTPGSCYNFLWWKLRVPRGRALWNLKVIPPHENGRLWRFCKINEIFRNWFCKYVLLP